MKIKIYRYITFIGAIIVALILYLSTIGIETDKFNNQIKKRIVESNNNLEIDLRKIKLILDPFNFKVSTKTVGAVLYYSNRPLPLEYIKTQISIKSLIKKKITSSNIEIVTRSILLNDLIRFIRATNNKPELFILEKLSKRGFVVLDIKLEFDESGNVKNNYEIDGILKDAEINVFNKAELENINFNFNLKKDNYSLEKIRVTANKIRFNSDLLNIKRKQENTLYVEGNIKNNYSVFSKSFLELLNLNFKSNIIDIEKSNFKTNNNFSLEIDSKFKFKNISLTSIVNIDKVNFKKPDFINNYFLDVNETILSKDHQLTIDYKKNKLSIKGNGSLQIKEKFNEIDYLIFKNKDTIKFSSNFDLDNIFLKKQDFLKEFFPKINKRINLSEPKLKINYENKKFSVFGKGQLKIDEDYDKINFLLTKKKNKLDFDIDLNLNKTEFKIDQLNYKKKNGSLSKLKILGNFDPNKGLNLLKLRINEERNKIDINNLVIDRENLILNIDNASFDYIDIENKQNQFVIQNKGQNKFDLNGLYFNANKLITNLLKGKNKNKNKIFKNNIYLSLFIDQVNIDEIYFIKKLNGKLFIKNGKVVDANLNANFKDKDKISFSIKTDNSGSKVTTLTSSWAKPLVKRYKFIKGFEDGYLDFRSVKNNGVSNSLLIIDDFKVKEIPILAKLLALASLQGIADLLTGEGIRFSDLEMKFSNDQRIMKIEELYAIGPSISILMEGYIETDKLISLRGTLVPASTINRTIASIPLIGDLLVGKKVGEGVFGVSFKIKGPPKYLETTVNPIKTLTPRFITRTLDKIKKN